MKRYLAGGALFLFVWVVAAMAVYPPQPGWWSAGNTTIIAANTTPNNIALLNQGQLRNTAVQARAYLNTVLAPAGGAGAAVNTTVDSITTGSLSGNFSPANLGQLKYVAKVFYDRLLAFGYDTRANLIDRGVDADWPYPYPWNPSTPVSENYAPANLGQLKLIFSFDLTSNTSGNIFSGSSANNYSLPRNLTALVGLSGSTDTDGDGVNDASDFLPLDSGFSGGALPNIGANATVHPEITLFSPTNAVYISTSTSP